MPSAPRRWAPPSNPDIVISTASGTPRRRQHGMAFRPTNSGAQIIIQGFASLRQQTHHALVLIDKMIFSDIVLFIGIENIVKTINAVFAGKGPLPYLHP